MQTASAQPVLLRRPRPPTKSVFDSVNQRCTKNAERNAPDFQPDSYVLASDDNCEDQSPPRRLCHSSLASHDDGEKIHGSSKEDRTVKLKSRKPHGPDRSYKQKSQVLHVPVDDEDIQKFYQPPKFTLRDFIVQFSTNENVPTDAVEKSLYSQFTYCKLHKILEERCQPRNTQLSTQQLQLPDDLPKVHHRVPHKQLLIEMMAIIREQLSKVDYICMFDHCSETVYNKCMDATLDCRLAVKD